MTFVVVKNSSSLNKFYDENPNLDRTKILEYRGYFCRIACVQEGKQFSSYDTEEAQNYLNTLQKVNQKADFGFIRNSN